VWVIGAQNAGKSTLINAFAKKQGVKITRLTEAAVPGTTLGILRMTGVLPAKAKVYDTPGLLHPYIMSMRLNSEERKMVEIRKELRPRTFRVKVNLKSVVNIVLVLFISHGVAETYLVLQ
jgi:ribosome biogenesis GTPase A